MTKIFLCCCLAFSVGMAHIRNIAGICITADSSALAPAINQGPVTNTENRPERSIAAVRQFIESKGGIDGCLRFIEEIARKTDYPDLEPGLKDDYAWALSFIAGEHDVVDRPIETLMRQWEASAARLKSLQQVLGNHTSSAASVAAMNRLRPHKKMHAVIDRIQDPGLALIFLKARFNRTAASLDDLKSFIGNDAPEVLHIFSQFISELSELPDNSQTLYNDVVLLHSFVIRFGPVLTHEQKRQVQDWLILIKEQLSDPYQINTLEKILGNEQVLLLFTYTLDITSLLNSKNLDINKQWIEKAVLYRQSLIKRSVLISQEVLGDFHSALGLAISLILSDEYDIPVKNLRLDPELSTGNFKPRLHFRQRHADLFVHLLLGGRNMNGRVLQLQDGILAKGVGAGLQGYCFLETGVDTTVDTVYGQFIPFLYRPQLTAREYWGILSKNKAQQTSHVLSILREAEAITAENTLTHRLAAESLSPQNTLFPRITATADTPLMWPVPVLYITTKNDVEHISITIEYQNIHKLIGMGGFPRDSGHHFTDDIALLYSDIGSDTLNVRTQDLMTPKPSNTLSNPSFFTLWHNAFKQLGITSIFTSDGPLYYYQNTLLTQLEASLAAMDESITNFVLWSRIVHDTAQTGAKRISKISAKRETGLSRQNLAPFASMTFDHGDYLLSDTKESIQALGLEMTDAVTLSQTLDICEMILYLRDIGSAMGLSHEVIQNRIYLLLRLMKANTAEEIDELGLSMSKQRLMKKHREHIFSAA